MKVLNLAVVFLAFVAAALAISSQWGARKRGDRLLYSQNMFNSSRPGNVMIGKVFFPIGGSTVRNITQIRAIDKVKNGTGAHPSLISGGPGFKYANLELVSRANYGINFRIEYYGN